MVPKIGDVFVFAQKRTRPQFACRGLSLVRRARRPRILHRSGLRVSNLADRVQKWPSCESFWAVGAATRLRLYIWHFAQQVFSLKKYI